MHFLPAGAASAPAHPQRDPRLQRVSRASVVFLLVPPSESRSPPALITVWIERASHRSSSSELLIFSLRSRARALGPIYRGENDVSLSAKLPARLPNFALSHRTKINHLIRPVNDETFVEIEVVLSS